MTLKSVSIGVLVSGLILIVAHFANCYIKIAKFDSLIPKYPVLNEVLFIKKMGSPDISEIVSKCGIKQRSCTYLGISSSRQVDFDLDGNIRSIGSSVGCLGLKFIYDLQQRNVIRECVD